MKNLLVASLLIIPLAMTSCTRTEKNVTVGAATGAVVGGLIGGNVRSAAVGAVIGGVTMAFVSKATRPGYCIYEDRRGRRHEARCR
ncbi:YMGG-like glycine zipper-containing protein [Rhizobium sp. LjRoot254]|uniref:YMGG-like glycine zipper-containing protein n=1 Tax=Rhizobium sp. LjRoot254 TaxID=3342297 RepID=UPI003ECC819A